MKRFTSNLCAGLLATAVAVSIAGCQGRVDGRAQEEPDDFDWKQAVEDAVESKANEKLNEAVDAILPGASVNLELDGNKLDFSFCTVQELLDRDITVTADLDSYLDAGKISGEIHANYGKLDFIVKVANLSDSVMGLKNCQVVSCRFESGELKLAEGVNLFSATRKDVEKVLGKPYRFTETKSYYLLPAFGSDGKYYAGYTKYLKLGFKAGILASAEIVIPGAVYHSLADNVEDEDLEAVENMDDARIEVLTQKKKDICELLKAELDARSVDCAQDAESGTLLLDSAALFEYNSHAVSAEGKELLSRICDAYCSVILSEDVRGEISSILFEGHASPEGDYESNLTLSQARAAEVRNSFIERLNETDAEAFEDLSDTVGHSFSFPKYDDKGNVDSDASRRVEIRFYLAVEE